MIRLLEILGIIGMTGISYIGIIIIQGGKKSAAIVSVIFSLALIIFNEKLEDETGKGIVSHIYCSMVSCRSDIKRFTDTDILGPESNGPSCEQQISAWNVRMADYRSQETQRVQQCTNVQSNQVTLNSEFFALKTEWPLAISFMKNCIKDSKNNENKGPLSCMDAVCIASAMSGYDCDPLQNKLRDIYNRQEEYIRRFRASSCNMDVGSDYFDAMGMAYTKPVGRQPSPPPAPDCLSHS